MNIANDTKIITTKIHTANTQVLFAIFLFFFFTQKKKNKEKKKKKNVK